MKSKPSTTILWYKNCCLNLEYSTKDHDLVPIENVLKNKTFERLSRSLYVMNELIYL